MAKKLTLQERLDEGYKLYGEHVFWCDDCDEEMRETGNPCPEGIHREATMPLDNLPDFPAPQFQEVDARTVRSQDEPLLSRNIGKMPFPRAAKSWLETRRAYISPRTFQDYQQYIVALGRCTYMPHPGWERPVRNRL
jgi:hypothetical protein